MGLTPESRMTLCHELRTIINLSPWPEVQTVFKQKITIITLTYVSFLGAHSLPSIFLPQYSRCQLHLYSSNDKHNFLLNANVTTKQNQLLTLCKLTSTEPSICRARHRIYYLGASFRAFPKTQLISITGNQIKPSAARRTPVFSGNYKLHGDV